MDHGKEVEYDSPFNLLTKNKDDKEITSNGYFA